MKTTKTNLYLVNDKDEINEEYSEYKDQRDREWEDAKAIQPLNITTEMNDYFERHVEFQKKLWRGGVV